jgi:cytochrome P450
MDRVPPAPPGRPLVGNAAEFAEDALTFMLKVRQYGDIVSILFGPFRIYVVNHPDLIHQLLVTDADKVHKSSVLKRAAGNAANRGLVTSDGDLWKRQRKLMQPAFHHKSIRAYAETAVDYTQRFIADWQPGQVYAIDQVMNDLTMHIIVKDLFGVEMGAEARMAGDLLLKLLGITNRRISQAVPIPDWVPTPGNRAFARGVQQLSGLLQGYIDQKRQSNGESHDLLAMLLAARDADDGTTMDDEQIRHELLTLFGAGYDTTAAALMWAWYLIAAHPDVEARFHAEIDTVLNGRAPTFDDLSKLTYTEQIMKEALRLYPPGFMMSRQSIETLTLGDYTFKPGSVFFINIYGVQRDARFFPDPERFDPQRFSPENEATIPKNAYLAFGWGRRICIGSALAMMNAKLILAALGSRYALSVAPGHIVEPEQVFALHARYGMKMVAHARATVAEPVL